MDESSSNIDTKIAPEGIGMAPTTNEANDVDPKATAAPNPSSSATKRAPASDPEEGPPKKKPALLPTAATGEGPAPLMPVDGSESKSDDDVAKPNHESTPASGTSDSQNDATAPNATASTTTESPPASGSEITKDPSKTSEPTPSSDPKTTAEASRRSSERVRSATTTETKASSPEEDAEEPEQVRNLSTAVPQPTAATTKSTKDAAATPRPADSKPTNSSSGNRTGSGSKKAAAVEPPKTLKGLRHFSMMVCKKVEEKATTTYNEVADELVQQVMEVRQKEDSQDKFDEKNIRRRVYDSINVLLAMDIISKDKKQITWKGLPTMAHHDIQLLEREEQARKEQVKAKRRALQELLVQQICFRNLVRHNKHREVGTLHAEKVPLPFIIVNTSRDAIAHCNMAPDLHNVMFEFDRPFEINDDNSILTRLGM
jgi:Transcription factor DP/E2F/DP family winged-helix DNA-binding domain